MIRETKEEKMHHQPRNRRDLTGVGEDILVGMARGRDEDAFSELMNRSRDNCLGLAMSILRNRDDAVDEVQNAFWKAYSHIESFSHQAKFSTWVSRIVINHCLMRIRRARRTRFVPYDGVSSEGDLYIAHEPLNPENPELQLGGSEVNRVIRQELALIPKSLRIPLQLRYLRDMALEDIARELQLTVPATKSRLHRGQVYLRDRMRRHCGLRGGATLTRVA
jgi:RNA polymerase sigma-70 factor, ECF subfamily